MTKKVFPLFLYCRIVLGQSYMTIWYNLPIMSVVPGVFIEGRTLMNDSVFLLVCAY